MTDQSPPQTIKPGWKTTEFWLSTAAKLLGVLYASGILGTGTVAERIAGLAATVLASFGYSVARSMVKSAGALIPVLAIGALCSCATAKSATAAGTNAFIDCEAAHFDSKLWNDARLVSESYVNRWIANGPAVDVEAIKADLAPVKTDLMRCAIAAAVAFGAKAVSAMLRESLVQPVDLQTAFQSASRSAGWPEVRVSPPPSSR